MTENHKESEPKPYNPKSHLTLDMKDLELLELIFDIGLLIENTELFEHYKTQISITGGFIRDKIKKKAINDYDLILSENIFSKINDLLNLNKLDLDLENYSCKILKTRNIYGCKLISFLYNGKRVEIKEVKGRFEEDFLTRDFTINAICYNVYKAEIFDYCGGMRDLKRNLVRCVRSVEDCFRASFSRFVRLARFESEGFFVLKEIKDFTDEFFSAGKFKFEPLFYQSWKFQMKRVFTNDNCALILRSMIKLKIFPYFYSQIPQNLLNPHSFSGQYPIIYLSIINLVEKFDLFFLKKEKIKKLYNLDEKEFKDNMYLLKSHSFIYYFHHPIFQNSLQLTQTKFQLDRIYVPSKYYFDIYNMIKHFNVNSFNKFDRVFKKMKFKHFYNYKLFTLMPIIDYYDKETIRANDFIEKLKKYEINNYFCSSEYQKIE